MLLKKTILVFVMLVLCSIGVACSGIKDKEKEFDPLSGNEPVVDQTSNSPVADMKKVEEMPTELTIVQAGASVELFNQRYGDQIRKRFPNYTINYIPTTGATYADTIATAETIDLVFTSASGMPQYLTAYNLESDINDLIKKYNYDISKLQSTPIDVQRHLGDGGIYGFPTYIGTLVFLYNKDLFDKFGVQHPWNDMTWDELFELARTMTRFDGGQQYRGLGMAWEHVVGWNQLSALYFDPDTQKAQFTNDNVKRVFENVARFWKISGNEPPGSQYGLTAIRNVFLKDQTMAMHLDSDPYIKITAEALENWGLAKYPVFPDLPEVGPAPNPTYGFVASVSQQRDAAFMVLMYLTSEEYQEWAARTLGSLPTVQNVEPLLVNFGENIPNFEDKDVQLLVFPTSGKMQQMSPYYNSIGVKEMITAINHYMAGQDVNTVLREASERTDKRVAEELAK